MKPSTERISNVIFCTADPATTIGSTRSRAATIVKRSRLTRAATVLSGLAAPGSSVVPKLVAINNALPVADSAAATGTKKIAAGSSVLVIAFEISWRVALLLSISAKSLGKASSPERSQNRIGLPPT